MSSVSIIYCAPCGYEKRAREAAEQLAKATGIVPTLVPGKGGVFRVDVGEETVVSRARGYFPTPDDIIAAVQAAQAPA
mgnify:CR=1 FL=1